MKTGQFLHCPVHVTIMTITRFIINKIDKNLTVYLNKGKKAELSFEFLRVFTPTIPNPKQQKSLITHKKQVELMAIENVAQHGYRLVFDDQHNAIYPTDYLALLIKEYPQRWQRYLEEVEASGHSREAMINITQL